MAPDDGDLAQVLAEVRARAAAERRARAEHVAVADDAVPRALGRLDATADPFRVSLASNRWLVGRPLLALKRLLRRFLTPILLQQAEYNATVASLVRMLFEDLDREVTLLRAETRRLALEIDARAARASGAGRDDGVAALGARVATLEAGLGALAERLARLEQATAGLR